MEIINYECYISLEVAKLLKEAGFDWKQYSFYNSKGILISGTFDANWNDKIWHIDGSKVSAPTLNITQKWLREVKGFNINICWLPKSLYGIEHFMWNAYFACDFLREGKPMYDVLSYGDNIEYCTYEEAQEAGIKKALETILEEEELNN